MPSFNQSAMLHILGLHGGGSGLRRDDASDVKL